MKRILYFVLPCLLLAAGCSGPVALPTLNLTIPLDDSLKFGPSVGVPAGQAVVNATFPLAIVCDAIDEAALQAQIRAVLGDTVGSLITIRRVLLTGISFSGDNGDFDGFSELSVRFAPTGSEGTIFGSITNSSGLGAGFTITPTQEFDALAILGGANCVALTLTYSGTTPARDIDFRVDAYVSVEAEASM